MWILWCAIAVLGCRTLKQTLFGWLDRSFLDISRWRQFFGQGLIITELISTSASVLEQLGVKAPQLLNLIKKQKLLYFGHIKRHNTLEKLFLEGTCEGRRGRGRPRRRWAQDIGEWMGVSTLEAGRQALERGEFRQAVWEATSIKDPP